MSPTHSSSTRISSSFSPRRLCDAWHPLEQPGELAARAPGCVFLEGVAAREHQRDHRTGEVLVERQCRRDGNQCDRIDPDVPAEQ